MAFSLHVFGERLNDAGRIHRWVPQGSRQIEQVASLLALIQRPQLGPQKFQRDETQKGTCLKP